MDMVSNFMTPVKHVHTDRCLWKDPELCMCLIDWLWSFVFALCVCVCVHTC